MYDYGVTGALTLRRAGSAGRLAAPDYLMGHRECRCSAAHLGLAVGCLVTAVVAGVGLVRSSPARPAASTPQSPTRWISPVVAGRLQQFSSSLSMGTHLSAMTQMPHRDTDDIDPCVRVYGTRVHNLRGVDVVAPRDALVAFTGISGSGKSSLAFGTIYAEAQRRYFESVAPYARRLLLPTGAPKVDDITGLPPAVALQQRRGSATSRSTVGTVTTLSNLLRMLFSRAGTYPPGSTERLDSDAFSPNTAVGSCTECHGLGRIHRVTEETLVPDPSLTIREGAVAAWPGAWQGQNLRDILVTLGYDIDKPWRKLAKRQRNWILFTDDQPTVEIDPSQHPVQADYYYNGTFSSAERHVRHTLANSHSAMMRRRVLQFVDSAECPLCHGSGLRPEALQVTFAGRTIADYTAMPLANLADTLRPTASRTDAVAAYSPPNPAS